MKKIKGYFLRVSEFGDQYQGYFGEIKNTLKAKQDYVGGYIQNICLEDIDFIMNDEGKIKRLPPNRAIIMDNKVVDIICGNILCVRHDDKGNYIDILESDKETIESILKPCIALGKHVICFDSEDLPEWKGD